MDNFSTSHGITRVVKWGSILVLTCLLYWPVFKQWGGDLWNDPNYSHGLLIPFIALYAWRERLHRLHAVAVKPCNFGIILVLMSLALLLVGKVGAEFFSQRVSFIFLLFGMLVFLEGKQVAKVMRFPVFLLLFAVPLPYILYNSVAFPLKLFASQIAVWFLSLLGMPVYREGNVISLAHTTLEVVDACSGIRSLMTLVTLAFLLAAFQHKGRMKRIIVFLLAVPLAVGANALRVAATGVLTSYDPKWGEGVYHESAGWFVFVGSFAVLVGLSTILKGRQNPSRSAKGPQKVV